MRAAPTSDPRVSEPEEWWRVSLVHYTCAFSVRDGKVASTPPILRRWQGVAVADYARWVETNGGTLEPFARPTRVAPRQQSLW